MDAVREFPLVRVRTRKQLDEQIAAERDELMHDLRTHGAVVYSGDNAGQNEPDEFAPLADVVAAMGGLPMEYRDPATPRTAVGDGVYTSTDYPGSEVIELHQEACYADTWPGYLYFQCVTPATERGGTTIADVRRVTADLPADLLWRLREHGLTYVRTFHRRFGLAWQQVFGTDDPDAVAQSCTERGIAYEWFDDGVLQTRQTWPALVRHPDTGEECWFNQAVAFHPAALPADVRTAMERAVGPDRIPKRVLFGDGTEITDEEIEQIRSAHARWTVPVRYCRGDLLIVDNILAAHGREPYRGPRRVLVAMSHPRSWAALPEVAAR